MTSQVVTVIDIERLTGRTFSDQETTRVQMDIDAVTESLEGWCRRKFVSTVISNERHQITGSRLFLHWGDPLGSVTVRYGSPDAVAYVYDSLDFGDLINLYSLSYGGVRTAYLTYTVDASIVEHFRNALKSVIVDAVLFKAMSPAAVRYNVITSYSVEGLSVSYGNPNGQSGSIGGVTLVSLSSISALRRSVIL